jgi:hypothetical protein
MAALIDPEPPLMRYATIRRFIVVCGDNLRGYNTGTHESAARIYCKEWKPSAQYAIKVWTWEDYQLEEKPVVFWARGRVFGR